MIRNTFILILLAAGFAAIASAAPGAGPGDYDLSWSTIDGGGGTSSGASFALSGTIGQPDAGAMSGGEPGNEFVLVGGFWAGAAAPDTAPACPGDLNNSGAVDVQDLLVLLGAWGPCDGACPADLNDSGAVDVQDLLILLGAWGPCPE